jgi:hypothetical protein
VKGRAYTGSAPARTWQGPAAAASSAIHRETHLNTIRTLAAALLAAIAAAAFAADNAVLADAQRKYEQERARCTSGQSHQDRATCLKEAGAAYDEARRGSLTGGGTAALAANATKRCEAQPEADRAACVQRILGAGTTQGSVEGGGVIRETETKTTTP